MRCEAGDDVWETVHEAASEITVTWVGLLLDQTYLCEASADGDTAPFEIVTPPGPAWPPRAEVIGSTSGLTLFNHAFQGHDHKLVVVDGQGRVRWYHLLEGNPNVGLEATFLPETSMGPAFLAGGGEGYAPTLLGPDGAVLWRAPAAASEGSHHHDALFLSGSDGEQILALAHSQNTDGDATWRGFLLERLEAWTGEPLWSWDSQVAVDRGQLGPHPAGLPDAYHANATTWHPEDPDGPSVWVSLKALHQVARLDLVTDDLSWRLGRGGDFALFEPDGAPAGPGRWFFGQHAPAPHLRDPSGVWDVYVYDNGMGRPALEPYSRVLHLEVDVPARSARIVWEWTEPGWYEPVFGDVDLLDNGHVLVTLGHCPHCPTSADERPGAVVEIDPQTDEVVWRLDLGSPGAAGYRAHRFDGCDLAPDSRVLCPITRAARAP